MAAQFDKLGIRFAYPENWRLDEDEALKGNGSVSVYSPGGGFWSIVIHSADEDPVRLSNAAVKAMRQVYSDLDSEEVEEVVAGQELVGHDLNFYCLDLTNTALVRSFRNQQATYVLICQAEDREFAVVEPVFRAMTTSLLRSAASENGERAK